MNINDFNKSNVNTDQLNTQNNFNINKPANINPPTSPNINNYHKNISKKGRIMMFIVLISTIIIFFDNFITSTDWFTNLRLQAVINGDEQLKLALETFSELIIVINWLLVFIITILSLIFLNIDKKNQKSNSIYTWYIVAGILHIIFGTIGLTPIIYSVATLTSSIKNKQYNKMNNLNGKSDNILIIFSSLLIISITLIFISVQINLFDKIKEQVKNYQENKEVVIEDNDIDNNYILTTFDKIINDWGNKITENKSYKIQSVKLNNITASIYIDYTYKLENEKHIATITIRHGDNELFTHTDKYNYFNLSFLKLYNNSLILYGARYCDSVDNGICDKHLTFSQVLAFNKNDYISLYDNSVISQGSGMTVHKDTSVFLEDENIYAEPYNDFRVYDIKINNDNIYFYTVVENYDAIFNQDYYFRDNNCNNPFWNSIKFDMQRIFKTKIIYNDLYKSYEFDELTKQSSIKYSDYCNNKSTLNLKDYD